MNLRLVNAMKFLANDEHYRVRGEEGRPVAGHHALWTSDPVIISDRCNKSHTVAVSIKRTRFIWDAMDWLEDKLDQFIDSLTKSNESERLLNSIADSNGGESLACAQEYIKQENPRNRVKRLFFKE